MVAPAAVVAAVIAVAVAVAVVNVEAGKPTGGVRPATDGLPVRYAWLEAVTERG